MRAKYVKFLDPRPGTPGTRDQHPGLTIGSDYRVLEISAGVGGGQIHFRVLDDDGRIPGLYDVRQFEVIRGGLPPTWVVHELPKGGLVFGPGRWASRGFWERYFDGDRESVRLFREELDKMVEWEEGDASAR